MAPKKEIVLDPVVEDEPISDPTPEPSSLPDTIGGKQKKVMRYGTRRKVWGGSAEMTKGGLRKEDLLKNQRGRIVSVKRHKTMKAKHTI